MKLELELYTPGEAEEITKVLQATVRNWRRAGHLARHEGHARYNIAELLIQTAMRAQVSRGVAPDVAKGFSSEIARATFQSIIYSRKAYSEEANAAAAVKVGDISPERIERVRAAAPEGFTVDLLKELDARSLLMDAAEQAFGLKGLKRPEWFIIWANGESQFYYDEDISEETFFGNTVYDEYVEGPVTLFCLGAMAKMVLDRLPRPPIKLAEEK